MERRVRYCNRYQKGECTYGTKCKFVHEIKPVNVLFSRLKGDTGCVAENVRVLLDAEKAQDLENLLANLKLGGGTNDESGSDSDTSDSSSGPSQPSQISIVEQDFDRKYGHIPHSEFRCQFKNNIIRNNTLLSQMGELQSSLERSTLLDYMLQKELSEKTSNTRYNQLLDFRKQLPVYKMKDEILKSLEKNQVLLITGGTGSGKTTQIAQFILDDYIMKNKGSLCYIVCTQPRRVSAVSVAQRVAAERGEMCSMGSVGYQIRLEKSPSRKQGAIMYCTVGILLQWMHSDPALTSVSHIILDEIHEQDINSEFVITVVREMILKRKDLRVILMSATLNAHHFSKYFHDCPIVSIPGMVFPVDTFYLEDVLQLTSYVNLGRFRVPRKSEDSSNLFEFCDFIIPYVRSLESTGNYSPLVIKQLLEPGSENLDYNLIVELLMYICKTKSEGAILVFLPGWYAISEVHQRICNSTFFFQSVCKSANEVDGVDSASEVNDFEEHYTSKLITGNHGKFLILPLHSKMPSVNQKEIFNRPPPGVRKIILSTNIAESSITIDDVVYVIDSGRMKVKNYDVDKNVSTLVCDWISQANVCQRKGRAGRVQPGECYHLYTKARERTFNKFPIPEMLRTRLEEIILQIKILHLGKVKHFLSRVMNPPLSETIEVSLKFLQMLKALDEDENLTPLGFHLAKLPLDPQIGKMIILAAIFSCVDPVFSVAACLSEKDPFFTPLDMEVEVKKAKRSLSKNQKSDHLLLAEAMKLWEEALLKNESRKFCKKNFLSVTTLRTLKLLKSEFAEQLFEMKFLKSKSLNDPISNINSQNDSIVKGVICAGLYPNVVIIEKIESTLYELAVNTRTSEHKSVKISKASINYDEKIFESPYLMYYKKLQCQYINIYDTTMVSSVPLIIFGCTVAQTMNKQITIDDSVSFRCNKHLSQQLQLLKKETAEILDKKFMDPGTIDWMSNCTETIILRTVGELTTLEDKMMLPPECTSGNDNPKKN